MKTDLMTSLLTAIDRAPSLDLIAFLWFLVITVGYSRLTQRGFLYRRSLMAGVQMQRRLWMQEMARRPDNRIQDIQLISNLATGHTFFASTSVIAVGAMAAMLGSGERVQVLLERLPVTTRSTPAMFEVKIFLLMALFVYAFFKFAWAFRVAHYCAIMIGATPPYKEDDVDARARCLDHAELCAFLAGISAEHAHAGLRTYFFATAALAWFLSPLFFILATTWVLLILIRREFCSRSKRAIAGSPLRPGKDGRLDVAQQPVTGRD